MSDGGVIATAVLAPLTAATSAAHATAMRSACTSVAAEPRGTRLSGPARVARRLGFCHFADAVVGHRFFLHPRDARGSLRRVDRTPRASPSRARLLRPSATERASRLSAPPPASRVLTLLSFAPVT